MRSSGFPSPTLLLVATLVPALLGAQEQVTTLVGSVRDSAGHALSGVEVRFNGGPARARTDEAGGFRIRNAPVGRLTIGVRRLGFAPSTTVITLRPGRIDSLVVSLSTVAMTLPGVTVEDDADARSKRFLAGFWERRSRGFGSFMTRADIEARNVSDFADVVRMIPSAAVTTVDGRHTIRFRRNLPGRDCPPQFWMDGMRLERAEADEFTPEDVEAIEIYPGPATLPPQFAPRPNTNTCGAVVIWSRVPG